MALISGGSAAEGQAPAGSLLGDGLIVAATLFAALYVILTSRLGGSLPALQLAGLQQGVGLVFALLLWVAVVALGWESPGRAMPTPATLALVGVSGVVQYALAFWLYLVGLRHLPVATAALFLALIPVFGAVTAVLFLGERLGAPQLLGGAAIIAALSIGTRSGQRPDHQAGPASAS